MTRTYTTGPWEWRPIGSKGDIGIYVLNAPPSCGVIARIPFTETKPQRENARLIAAAPDLLAVCQRIAEDPDCVPAYLVAMAIHAVGRAKG
jgi:hypothetical protein